MLAKVIPRGGPAEVSTKVPLKVLPQAQPESYRLRSPKGLWENAVKLLQDNRMHTVKDQFSGGVHDQCSGGGGTRKQTCVRSVCVF